MEKNRKFLKCPKSTFLDGNDERRSEMVLLSKMTHWFVISKTGQSGKMKII